MNVAAIQPLQQADRIEQLSFIERYRLTEFENGIQNTIDERNDLTIDQKQSIIEELKRRVTQVALERHLYRESPNIALRGINLHTTPPETLCETFIKGSVIGLGMVIVSSNPITGGVALTTAYVAKQAFDDECFVNKFLRWLGCSKKAEPEPPLVLTPLNQNQR